MIFLSICVCSIRPENMVGMLDNLQATAADPTGFEVLICVNEGDDATIQALEAHRPRVTIPYRIIAAPRREGYFSLHHGYEALRAAAAPSAYFIWQISDEIRVETQGWDTLLKRYVKLFPDDLFRLRLSLNKGRHYHCLYECFPLPDNYTVTARAWYDVTEGSGKIWGPDSWHQAIDYFLGQLNNPYEPYGKGIFRSVPVYDVKLANEEAGQGLTGVQFAARKARIKRLYKQLCGLKAQENFLRLAQLVNMRIWMAAYGAQHADVALTLQEDPRQGHLRVVQHALSSTQRTLYSGSYRILPFLLKNAWKRWRRMLPNAGLAEYALYSLRRTLGRTP